MSYLDKVNELRTSLGLKPLRSLPRIDNRCEHCLSKLSDDELDHERCNTCERRVNVRMSHEEWERLKSC